MKKGQIFYHAKKYGRTIRRNFSWDDKCKVESDHIIYFDVIANNYRRANKPAIISEDGKETFHGYVEVAKNER